MMTGSTMADVPPSIPDHQLLHLIGRGSYGEVWLARNALGTLRAVKVVHRRTFESERPYKREFDGIRSFEPISRSHEGFVQVLHVGRNDSAGFFYYVMELADDDACEPSEPPVLSRPSQPGESECSNSENRTKRDYRPRTLASDIRHHGALPSARCVEIGLALTSALSHLHKAGLVHRDLKPSNIIFVGGLPKLADIGLVSAFGGSRSYVGTEGFVPPEGPGTPAADLYSLGKTLYEMSSGKDRESFPEIPAGWIELAHTAPELEFHEIVSTACEGRLEDRYTTADEMHAELALLKTGRSVRRLRTLERRLARMTKFGLAAVFVATLALAGSWFYRHQAARDRENLRRVETAEREARRQLWNSLVAQSRAVRSSPNAGRRFASLDLVRRAAALELEAGGDRLILRNEVIASLAVADVRASTLWSTPSVTNDLSLLDLDRDRAFATTPDGGIRVHSMVDGGGVTDLPGSGLALRYLLATSPDGRHLVAGDVSRRLRVWDLEKERLVWSSRSYGGQPAARFTPDGRQLAVLDPKEGRIEFYDLSTESPVRVLAVEPARGAAGLRFSPDGHRVALAASTTKTITVHDVDSGDVVWRFELPLVVTAFDWQPRGPLLAASCDDRKVRVWNTESGQLHAVLSGHAGLAVALAFDGSGEFLASSSYDGTTRLWNLHSGEAAASLPQAGVLLRFDSSGRRLAFIPWTAREVQICDVALDRVCRRLPAAQTPALLSEKRLPSWTVSGEVRSTLDGRWLASGGSEAVRLWDANTLRVLWETNLGHAGTVEFARDNQALFTVGERGILRWPLAWNESNRNLSVGAPEMLASAQSDSRAAWNSNGTSMAWVDGRRACVRDADGPVREFPAPRNLTQVALSPDARWLAAAAFSGKGALVWDLNDVGVPAREIPTRVGPSIQFTPDSQFLVVGTEREFGFWNPGDGQRHLAIPRADTAGLSGPMAFAADGRTMAVAATRSLIRLVNWHTGAELATLESAHGDHVGTLNFTHDSARLMAAVGDGHIEVWDLEDLHRQVAALGLGWR